MPVAICWNTNLIMLTSALRSKDVLHSVCMKARYDDLEPSIYLCAEFSGRNLAGFDDCQMPLTGRGLNSFGLGPRDFQDKKDSRKKKGLPDLLRRR
eukprot:6511238-Ditylum_brightwellii.AAC.1